MSNDALTERLERAKRLQRGWYVTQLPHNAPQLASVLVGQPINISGVLVRTFPDQVQSLTMRYILEHPDGLVLLYREERARCVNLIRF